MICPGCGCEQRPSEHCVQCQLVIPAHLSKGAKSATIARVIPPPAPPLAPPTPAAPAPAAPQPGEMGGGLLADSTARKMRLVEGASAACAVEAGVPIPIGGVARKSPVAEGQILITTTQQIEGKTVGAYFGLINANAIIEVDSNYSGVKSNNNLLIMNDFKYFSCFLKSKIGRVARL